MKRELFLYSKSDCVLCDSLKSELDTNNVPYHLIMIDNDLELIHRYGARVPVLEAGNTLVCEGRLESEHLQSIIKETYR
jgi:ABC-type uncharacterized transport system ATPase subunit